MINKFPFNISPIIPTSLLKRGIKMVSFGCNFGKTITPPPPPPHTHTHNPLYLQFEHYKWVLSNRVCVCVIILVKFFHFASGDSLRNHNGRAYSTFDADHDTWSNNCALSHRGAWWYAACHSSNLNGRYYEGGTGSSRQGVEWSAWKGGDYSMMKTEMKIRAV